mgnify:CR=1 FL=1
MSYKKLFSLPLFCLFITGCGIAPYISPTEGPKSKVTFTAPIIHETFMANEDLDLIIFDKSGDCDYQATGKIELEPDVLSQTFYLPANERAYLKAWYFQNIFGGGHRKGSFQFYFLAQEEQEYIVEYIESPGKFKVNTYRLDENKEREAIQITPWWACPKA